MSELQTWADSVKAERLYEIKSGNDAEVMVSYSPTNKVMPADGRLARICTLIRLNSMAGKGRYKGWLDDIAEMFEKQSMGVGSEAREQMIRLKAEQARVDIQEQKKKGLKGLLFG